jgi:hypothetical protein
MSRRTGTFTGLACLALWLALTGCQGRGRVDVAALNFQAVDPPAGPPAEFTRLEMDRCYWWTDDQGKVWVAMERDQPIGWGTDWHFKFQLSLALDQPPAGRARDYLVTKRELRAVSKFGPSQSRFVSLVGVVALYREPDNRLRGSFRLQVAREMQELLGNWSAATRWLMLGTFEAVPDPGRGKEIATESEAFGPQRESPAESAPPPASQPSQ